jgi:RNA-binding protein 26
MPGAPPAPQSFVPTIPPPSLPATMSGQPYGSDAFMANVPHGPQNGSRKRSYGDFGDVDTTGGGHDRFGGNINGRLFKQPRRGGSTGRAGRFDSYGNGRGGRQMQPPPMNPQHMPPAGFPNLPQMPPPPPGMPPIDPNNPLAAMLTMQAMGFPVPGMPSYQQSNSPVGQSNSPRAGFTPAGKRQRCIDYDTKGFCARGNTCMYEHGSDSIYVPPSAMDGMWVPLVILLVYQIPDAA